MYFKLLIYEQATTLAHISYPVNVESQSRRFPQRSC